ncbi:hypothetical protein M406DRAFT_102281 [Cryphonectria parasitica EP155]|uniref:Uncharacterized protein n=1 Tax=Cryphonectria parasitica (strain ATCC 38755 / EP155) TaxID=660469 RepID=A0A9P5CPN4_CRYP1|nr:uncharacterized protein M406DRAFT_102281 [Cryphonectria parasitica EP155]KAF3765170.1 hypothetical protein M406DRAFT_102281 [Cryphonectria parasitica EP155]
MPGIFDRRLKTLPFPIPPSTLRTHIISTPLTRAPTVREMEREREREEKEAILKEE